MKISLLFFALTVSFCASAQVGINTNTPHLSAVLEIESTNKGFLPPRMTQAQRDAITSPAEGLMVYCTDCASKGLYTYNGTSWSLPESNSSSIPSVVANCTSNGFVGSYVSGLALEGATFSITITNNSLSVAGPVSFATSDLVLSGFTGLSVGTPSPASATIDPGASQTITYPITGTPASTGTLTGSWSKLSLNCTNTKVVVAGVIDRMFGIADNTGSTTTHNFVYLPITGADGKTWLNNNLGADYANMNHASFNPVQQATSAADHLAYGSLFQWGRKSDGHELITWTSGTTGTAVNGTSSIKADNPTDALFILVPYSTPYDWRITQDDTLWATEASANNPCPVGYRVPTLTELNTLVTAASITNSATAASSTLKFTVPGNRSYASGTPVNVGSSNGIWSSSVNGIYASYRYFTAVGMISGNSNRANGRTVRCLKD